MSFLCGTRFPCDTSHLNSCLRLLSLAVHDSKTLFNAVGSFFRLLHGLGQRCVFCLRQFGSPFSRRKLLLAGRKLILAGRKLLLPGSTDQFQTTRRVESSERGVPTTCRSIISAAADCAPCGRCVPRYGTTMRRGRANVRRCRTHGEGPRGLVSGRHFVISPPGEIRV